MKKDYIIMDRVLSILVDKPDARDDDSFLFRKYWETIKMDFPKYKNHSLEYAMENKLVDNYSTIVTCRKKIQRKQLNLRGHKYEERQIMGGRKKKSQIEDIRQLKFKF
jgi:hypothetical protein